MRPLSQFIFIVALTFNLNVVRAAGFNFPIDTQTEYDFIRAQLQKIEFQPVNAFEFTLQRNKSNNDNNGTDLYEIEIRGKENYFRVGRAISEILDSISLNKGRLHHSSQQYNQDVHQVIFNGTMYSLRSISSIDLIQSFYDAIWLTAKDVKIVNLCGYVVQIQTVQASFSPLKEYLFNENVALGYLSVISLSPLNVNEYSVIHVSDMEYLRSVNDNRLDHEVFDYSLLMANETYTVKRTLVYDGIRYSERQQKNELDCTFSIAYTNEGVNVSKFLDFNNQNGRIAFENTAFLLNLNAPSVICGNFVASHCDLRMSIRTTDRNVILGSKESAPTYLNELGFPQGKYNLRERTVRVNDSLYHATQILRYRAYGWENALLSAAVPGWGMKKVSGSMQKSVLCFGMVALPVVFALSAEGISRGFYSKYFNESADSPIGSSHHYVLANRWHKASLISAGVSALAWMFQVTWVIKLGIENDIEEKMIQSEIQTNKLIYVDEFKEHVQY